MGKNFGAFGFMLDFIARKCHVYETYLFITRSQLAICLLVEIESSFIPSDAVCLDV